ncbi:LOW QUALITY PROTEIN: acyl-CoA-binding domain-containing protein 4 [Heterocephalus glaber]|uniref:LOW QUALITY PROTEIN: acyl-CoA-binding domain-containing protein 4 n=1 Tax=Heterocephalus glaber TaxID=10181 RepID=A0AAX6RG03_HETGA|nr:LOW QUALITY PROTEIN: acyl-CoA-binding domain-containing protein 4 [Heterocephalus glaber]
MGTERGGPEPACREQFRAAVSVIQSLPRTGSYRPSYEEMLRFYSYYKQATLGPCLAPRPGFWDPIGRYKWDAWHSLGRMSRAQAMSAYVAEVKLVAQKVIDTVPLGEVAEDAFAYFAPLYQVIPNMPRPPEAFLRRVTGWKEQVLPSDDLAVPGPACFPKEPAPPGPESQNPRDLDLEVFCDCLEQLEPDLVRPPLPPPPQPRSCPVPPHLVTQVWTQQRGAAGGDPETGTSPEPPMEKAELGGDPRGPQELDTWLVGTVRALQVSMQDVRDRLHSLESKPRPPVQPGLRPWPLRLSAPTLLFFLLWPFVAQWLLRQLRTQKR